MVVSVLPDASPSSLLGHFGSFFFFFLLTSLLEYNCFTNFGSFFQLPFMVQGTLIIYAHIMISYYHGLLKDSEIFSR